MSDARKAVAAGLVGRRKARATAYSYREPARYLCDRLRLCYLSVVEGGGCP